MPKSIDELQNEIKATIVAQLRKVTEKALLSDESIKVDVTAEGAIVRFTRNKDYDTYNAGVATVSAILMTGGNGDVYDDPAGTTMKLACSPETIAARLADEKYEERLRHYLSRRGLSSEI